MLLDSHPSLLLFLDGQHFRLKERCARIELFSLKTAIPVYTEMKTTTFHSGALFQKFADSGTPGAVLMYAKGTNGTKLAIFNIILKGPSAERVQKRHRLSCGINAKWRPSQRSRSCALQLQATEVVRVGVELQVF